jgi:HPt (histidine-containing phosphotransfer) domain-containing protein
MTHCAVNPKFFYSDFAADPDLADVIELFVAELPTRIADLRAALAAGDLPKVRRLAHQLKGAGGSHGFPQLGPLAWKLEQAAQGVDTSTAASILDNLAAICTQVRAGGPPE